MKRNPSFILNSTKVIALLISLSISSFFLLQAQTTSFNFHHLTDADGLSDGVVHDFVKDQYGFVWIGTSYGLNRFDGINIKTWFAKSDDSTSLGNNFIQSLYLDSHGNLWIGTFTGMCRYDYAKNQFINYKAARPITVNDILEDKNGKIWLGTNDGIWDIGENQLTIQPFTNNGDEVFQKSFHCAIRQMVPSPDGNWYIATNHGIRIFNPIAFTYSEIRSNRADSSSITEDGVISAEGKLPEKTIKITISQIFYKTRWFIALLVGLVGAGFISFLRYRILHREKIFVLNNKAQLLEREKTLVMYENLKQHLNPHFLFNSLTSLSSLIRVDQEMAGDFLEKMSKVYRYILKNRDNETVPLSEELNFVNMFIQLQKTRFGDSLDFRINIDEESMYRKVPPVTLQNLVENAMKHNVADVDSPLVIEIYTEPDYLVVRNNLQLKKFVETSNQQGLANMVSLYHYLSRKPMIIDKGPDFFTVKVPML